MRKYIAARKQNRLSELTACQLLCSSFGKSIAYYCFSFSSRASRKREMSTSMESSRARAPSSPTALVLAFLLVVSSSWPHVADGVRTTPLHGAGASTSPAGGGEIGEAVPTAASSVIKRRADKADRMEAALPEEEEGPAVVAEREEERAATGSRPPDCAHACGPCSPCRRVMVSFSCALMMASESCPVAYRCVCHGRFFRVPSL